MRHGEDKSYLPVSRQHLVAWLAISTLIAAAARAARGARAPRQLAGTLVSAAAQALRGTAPAEVPRPEHAQMWVASQSKPSM